MLRFFAILFRNWTYEIEYRLEIIRIIFIFIVTIAIPAPLCALHIFSSLTSLIIAVSCMVLWHFNIRYAFGRLMQIKKNKKSSRLITPNTLLTVFQQYPNLAIFCKINGKYKKILPSSETDLNENDRIILIMIGKKPLCNYRKIKTILSKETCLEKQQ